MDAIDTQRVTATSDAPLKITAPADVILSVNSMDPIPVSLGNPTLSGLGRILKTNDAPDTFSNGTTTVTWTATDDSGNIATDTQLVILIYIK